MFFAVWYGFAGFVCFRPCCSVLQEVHRFVAWPQSPNFVPVTSRGSRFVGVAYCLVVRFWRRKKCKTVGNFLFGFTLYHAHYIFIRVTNDFIVYYRQGGRQCCFMSLSALLFDRLWFLSLLSLDCRNRGPYLGIWRQNEFRFFSGRTYTRYRNASISNLPFAVRWIAESSRAIGFPTSQTRTHAGQK